MDTTPQTSRRWRRRLANSLAIAAGIVVVLALTLGYLDDAVYNSDHFADRATSALSTDAVKEEIATIVTTDVAVRQDPDLLAFRPVIQDAIEGLIGTGIFQSLFHAAVTDAHRALVHQDESSVLFTLADIGEVVSGAISAVVPESELEAVSQDTTFPVVEIEPPQWFVDLTELAGKLSTGFILLIVLALLMLAATTLLEVPKRRTLLVFCNTIVIAAIAVMVGVEFGKAIAVGAVDDEGLKNALAAVYDAFADDLKALMFFTALAAAIVAAAAASLIRPIEAGQFIAWARRLVTTTPQRHWLRVLRALVFIGVGVLIIAERQIAFDIAIWTVGLLIVYIGTAELIRVAFLKQTDEERERNARLGRRSLIAAGIAGVGLLMLSIVFAQTGGISSERSLRIDTVGCNGSEDYCDIPLDRFAFPATHNSMSGGDNPEWMFAQHEAGIPKQLADGVRGFLIDAHLGRMTESGRVATDFTDSENDGETYKETLGEDGFAAALRLRDRVVDSQPVEEPNVYLCHGFCELGATPLRDTFKAMSDFLDANPDEVLTIVIEDYVPPSMITDIAEETGLADHVYKGPLDKDNMPTLQEMIDSGGRILLMAENHGGSGDTAWYRPAFKALMQETPYSFHEPSQLTDPKKLPASCAPNRGPESAPFFQMNHWIDTSPAPKPSNARIVNTREVILRRAHECEKLRGVPVGLVAVDFYRTGDLFGAVRDLNASR